MPTTVTRDEVQDLMESENAQVVEVLPQEEYEWAHLRGARSIPLADISEQAPRELDASRPVISYCHDFQ
jgi:rhodanese-related sulfurtransferase